MFIIRLLFHNLTDRSICGSFMALSSNMSSVIVVFSITARYDQSILSGSTFSTSIKMSEIRFRQ